MSSMAAGANPERTNRWMLIGAIVLAVLAGVLVFFAATNLGGDDGVKSSDEGVGNATVLIANKTINANETINEADFDVVSGREAVEGAASDSSTVIGKVAKTEIIKGQQISLLQVSLSDENIDDGLAAILPKDKLGFAIAVDQISVVAGFVQQGDRVNILGVFQEDRDNVAVPNATEDKNNEITRVEVLLQNVEVLAVAQNPVEAVASVNAEGTPVATTGFAVGPGGSAIRPDEVKPKPDAGSVTLALTPQDVLLLAAARARGTLVLTLRPLGEEGTIQIEPTYWDQFGPLPVLPRR